MRVMWLLGRAPADVARVQGTRSHSGGGWQDALLARVRERPEIELLVAYPGPERGISMDSGGVRFACIGPLEPVGRVARVVLRWTPRDPDLPVLEECVRLAAEWHPDVVHLHGTESGLGLIAGRMDAPVLVSLQGLLGVYETIAREGGSRRAPARSTLGEFARGLSAWHDDRSLRVRADIERRTLRECRFVAGRTEFDRRVASVLAPDAEYFHVGELLRGPFIGPRWDFDGPRDDGGEPVLCVSGSNYRRKGIDVAILAVRILHDAGCPVRLDIIGAPADSLAGRSAMAEARRLGISERVVLSGVLDAEHVAEHLLASDVFLLPSRADNSPNALCEAMALGVPCVASTAGGVPSLATDGEDSLLVPPGDPYSLAGAVRTLSADRKLAALLAEAARIRSLARHDPVAVTGQLVTTYQEIAGGRGV